MKIIPHNTPEPSPAPLEQKIEPAKPDAPVIPTIDFKEQMKGLLQEFAVQTLTDIQSLERKMDHSQNEQSEQGVRNSQAIIKLAEELGALKKALHEMRSAALATPAPTLAPPKSDPPPPDPIVPEALNTITREISKLSGEMSGLRKAIAEFQKAEPVKAPEPVKTAEAPVEIPKPIEAPQPEIALSRIDFLASMNEPPRKVALLTKLWDYLNQVAFEIPLGKQSQ